MKNNKIFDWIMWIVLILVSLAIGGTFVDGGYLNTTILKLFPEIIHQLVGWIIIITTVIGAFIKLFR